MVAPNNHPSGPPDNAEEAKRCLRQSASMYCQQAVVLALCSCRTCQIGACMKTASMVFATTAAAAMTDERLTPQMFEEMLGVMTGVVHKFKADHPDADIPNFTQYVKPEGK